MSAHQRSSADLGERIGFALLECTTRGETNVLEMRDACMAAIREHEQAPMPKPDLWHTPIPGPLYWDWRCRVCGEAVDDHPSWWRRWRRSRGKSSR